MASSTTLSRADLRTEDYLSPARAAAIVDVCEMTIRRWVAAGKLPHTRLGRLIRISRADLAVYAAERGSADQHGGAA